MYEDLQELDPVDHDTEYQSEWRGGNNYLHVVYPHAVVAPEYKLEPEGEDFGHIGEEDRDDGEEFDDEELDDGGLGALKSKRVKGVNLEELYMQLLVSWDLNRCDSYYSNGEGFFMA